MKKAKERREQGLFVVEGIKMFREAPEEWIEGVYVSEQFMENPEHETLLSSITYEVVADSVFKAVSDTQTPQGILALIRMPHYTLEDVMQGERTHLLLLESVQDPGNLGTIVRTAEGAGVTGIVMSQDCVDMYNPKVVRSTMGAAYRVPFCYVEDLAEEVMKMKEAGICTYAAHLEGKNSYDEEDYRKASAFLIGNEGNGLRDEVADQAQVYIRIPMKGQVESLNAAVATAILTFEAARQRR